MSDVVAALEGAERWIMEQRRSHTYGGEPIPELVAIQAAIPVAREQAGAVADLRMAMEEMRSYIVAIEPIFFKAFDANPAIVPDGLVYAAGETRNRVDQLIGPYDFKNPGGGVGRPLR